MFTERRIELLSDIEKLGKIVFRAANTKKQQPVKVNPCKDKTGKLYTGQGKEGYFELLTPKEKENISPVFDHTTIYTVEDGKILDIEKDPFDRALWKWIKTHPYIGFSKDECINSDAVFYVDNPQKAAESFVTRKRRITKASAAIFNASPEQKVAVSRAMGLNGAEGLSDSQIEEWLIVRAETSPDSVLDLVDPKNAALTTAMGLVKDFMTYNVIKQFGTAFMYGGREGITLGNSEDEVALWVSDTKHEDTVSTMMYDLNEEKGL